MTINTSLLIAAPMLQDYLVDDASGLPLAAGIVTCFQDNSRSTLKNWYYQSGIPGNYTYIKLPNPMTLSSVGTINDGNGNDVIPFYYPYDENSDPNNPDPQPYYITVDNSNGQRQFSRANFPFNPNGGSSGNNIVPTLNNLITNNVFWRNVGSVTATNLTSTFVINSTTYYYTTIAPSKHDGFAYQMSDIQYFKNTTGGDTETITFNNFVANFSDQIIPNDVTPEFYLNFNCSTSGGTATTKYIQIPIQLHVDSLSGFGSTNNNQVSIVIDAMAVTGSPTITASIFQFLGSGATSTLPTPLIPSMNLTNTWKRYVIPATLPSAQGLTLGAGGDDALYLQINLPVTSNSSCNINIAKPAVYLSANVPTNDFQTYDDVNSVINSPRTGDIKQTFNAYVNNPSAFSGFVLMNDGVISLPSTLSLPITLPSGIPSARANSDTFPLFNLLWNTFDKNGWQSLVPMYSSAGSPVAYGSSAITDFSAGNQLMLPTILGKVLAGADYIGTFAETYTTNFASNNNLTVTSGFDLGTGGIFTGAAVFLTTTTSFSNPLVANTIYYAIQTGSTTFELATSYANAIAGTAITLTSNGTGQTVHRYVLGGFTGEEQSSALLAHSHTLSNAGHAIDPIGSGGAVFGFATISTGDGVTVHNSPLGGSTDSSGSGTSFPIMQPTTYTNFYIKL